MRKTNIYIEKMGNKWLLNKIKYTLENPVAYSIITGINIYFWFDRFGNNYNILLFFIMSILAGIITQLQKYRVINFLDTSRNNLASKIRIYSFITLTMIGIASAIILLVLGIIIELTILLSPIVE